MQALRSGRFTSKPTRQVLPPGLSRGYTNPGTAIPFEMRMLSQAECERLVTWGTRRRQWTVGRRQWTGDRRQWTGDRTESDETRFSATQKAAGGRPCGRSGWRGRRPAPNPGKNLPVVRGSPTPHSHATAGLPDHPQLSTVRLRFHPYRTCAQSNARRNLVGATNHPGQLLTSDR